MSKVRWFAPAASPLEGYVNLSRVPHEILRLEERLRNRLESGRIAHIIIEQGAFLDDFGDAREYKRGTQILIDQLEQALIASRRA